MLDQSQGRSTGPGSWPDQDQDHGRLARQTKDQDRDRDHAHTRTRTHTHTRTYRCIAFTYLLRYVSDNIYVTNNNYDTTTIHIRSDPLYNATARDHNTTARLYPD